MYYGYTKFCIVSVDLYMICAVFLTEFRTDSATADPALVKERSIALRRRVSSRPVAVNPPRIGLRSSADHASPGLFTVLAIFIFVVCV